MEQSSVHLPGDLFGSLSAVQIVELGVVVKGKLPKDLPTQIQVGYNSQIESRDGKDTLQVAVRIDASAREGETEIYSARCQVVGAWPMLKSLTLSEEDLSKVALVFAAPIVYAVARQNIADVLNKAGIHPDQWPWNVLPAIQRNEEAAERPTTRGPLIGKSDAPHRSKRKAKRR